MVRAFSVDALYNIADALDVAAGDLLQSSVLSASKKDKKNHFKQVKKQLAKEISTLFVRVLKLTVL